MTDPKSTAKPARKGASEARRPYHVGVALGLSTGLYAISLAAVTTFQVAEDRALIAEREPMREAIDLLADHHRRMIRNVDAARRQYEVATDGYGDVAERLTTVEGGLAELNDTVSSLEGTALRLPDRLDLPKVPKTTSSKSASNQVAPAATPPPTHGKTGASGGKP